MKSTFTIFLVLYSLQLANSQCPNPSALSLQSGNNIEAMISNGGDLFWDGNDAQFNAPASPIQVSSIFAASLWMGGYDPAGNLKVAAPTYGRSNGSFDYIPGPIRDDGIIEESDCTNFDKIWTVVAEDILSHKADFADNGVIDNPIDAIFGWPANGSSFFQGINGYDLPVIAGGYAEFFDENQNGIYEPDGGDYPIVPSIDLAVTPSMINWTIFNDLTIHNQSGGDPIRAEVRLTSWSFNCTDNTVLNNTIFTSHKIINKGVEAINSFSVGLWVDFDLGCYTDDYIGSSPTRNAFFAYNSDEVDGNGDTGTCVGEINTYASLPPAQSVQFLNKTMDNFMYYNNGGANPVPPPGTTDPANSLQYYNLLTGVWRDGTPLVYGQDGYDPASTDYTPHAFPNDPTDEMGWSMVQESLPVGDFRAVGGHKISEFNPGQIMTLDMAYTFHQDAEFNHLEIVNEMYDDIELVKSIYDMQFINTCSLVLDDEEVLKQNITISPNPSSGSFKLDLGTETISGLQLFDLSGKLLWADQSRQTSEVLLDFNNLSSGIYLLNIISDNISYTEKLVIY